MAFVGLGMWRFLVVNNVGQASVLENTGRCVSHIQEHLIKFAMVRIVHRVIRRNCPTNRVLLHHRQTPPRHFFLLEESFIAV